MPYRLFAVCQLWCLTASEEAGYSDFLFGQFGSIANVVQFSFFLFTFCFGSFGFSLLPWSKRVYVVIATCKMAFFPCPQMMEVVFSQNVFDCAKHIIVIHTHTPPHTICTHKHCHNTPLLHFIWYSLKLVISSSRKCNGASYIFCITAK